MSSLRMITKTLIFNLEPTVRERNIINKLTARLTFGVQLYLSIIKKEQNTNKNGLDKLTITTAKRTSVKYDLKKKTGLGAVFLQQCRDTAVWLMESYQALHSKWEQKQERASFVTIISMLVDIDITKNGSVINRPFEKDIKHFNNTRLWRRLKKNEPQPPLENNKRRPKKLPTQFDSRNLSFYEKNREYYIKFSTLQPRKKMTLKLKSGDYHRKELKKGRITGGKLVKNYNNNGCWEFHATLKIAPPKNNLQVKNPRRKKVAILGVDLGIATDATVVALLEEEPLSQDQFFFMKEGDIRKNRFNLEKRRRILQKTRITSKDKNKRKKATSELKNITGKIARLTNEVCHRISKKIANITENYIKNGFMVHVVVGELKGIRNIARKGNGKGKNFRGRINRFPYHQLTSYIKYKCLVVGAERVVSIRESWTSRICHKCGSTNTERPTQAQFICRNCGLHFNADANGAINIAFKYWSTRGCSQYQNLNTSFKKEVVSNTKTVRKN